MTTWQVFIETYNGAKDLFVKIKMLLQIYAAPRPQSSSVFVSEFKVGEGMVQKKSETCA